MSRYTRTPVSTLQGINNELAKVELAIDNTLDRKGSTPNAMDTNLDMNSRRILNLPAPLTDQEPLRRGDIPTGLSVSAQYVDDAIDEVLNSSTLRVNDVQELKGLIIDTDRLESVIRINEYHEGTGYGSGEWEVVTGETANDIDIIQSLNPDIQFKLVFDENLRADQLGVLPYSYSNRVNNFNAIQRAIILCMIGRKPKDDLSPISGTGLIDFNGNVSLVFPEGVIYVEGNSPFFPDPTQYGVPVTTFNFRRGFKVQGQGKESTILELCKPTDSTEDVHFYDNSSVPDSEDYGWDFVTYEDMTFRSEYHLNVQYSDGLNTGYLGLMTRDEGDKYHGFKLTSGGREKFCTWRGCKFLGLDDAASFNGASNVASNHFVDCNFENIRDNVLYLNNKESVAHEFTDCDFEPILGNLVRVSSSGGGYVKFSGGSCVIWPQYDINGPIERTFDAATLRLDVVPSGYNLRSAVYTFNHLTFEKYDPKYYTVFARQLGTVDTTPPSGGAPRYPAGASDIEFQRCSWATDSIKADDTVNELQMHDTVFLDGDTQVNLKFLRCGHNPRHRYRASNQTTDYVGGSQITFENPRLLWDAEWETEFGIEHGGTLSSRCFTSDYVSVVCRNPEVNFNPNWKAERKFFNLEFDDINEEHSPYCRSYKRGCIKPVGHEWGDGLTNGDTNTATFSQTSKIVQLDIHRPAYTGAGDAAQSFITLFEKVNGAQLWKSPVQNLATDYSTTITFSTEDAIQAITDGRIEVKWEGDSVTPPSSGFINCSYL